MSSRASRLAAAAVALWAAIAFWAAIQAAPARAETLQGATIVREDGTLWVSGRRVQLWGVVLAPSPPTCLPDERPASCGQRAVLALDRMLDGAFARCEIVCQPLPPAPISARCTARGQDLAAWLLINGWAVADDGAPGHYRSLEHAAIVQGRGVWSPTGGRLVVPGTRTR